jgi:hypothetical protein
VNKNSFRFKVKFILDAILRAFFFDVGFAMV